MFMGQYNHGIDEKGRLIMPSKYRDELGKEFVVTKGSEGCLFVYPMKEWEKIEEQVKGMALNGKEGRKFIRMFFSSAALLELDKQGRVLIPALLKEHAGLDKEVCLIGSVSHIEIWDKTRWDAYVDSADMDEVADFVAKEGLIF